MTLQNTSYWQIGNGNPNTPVVKATPAQNTYAADTTLTVADITSGAVVLNSAGNNLTLPLATDVDAALPNLPVGASFEFAVTSIGAGTATVVTNTGWTTVGRLTTATATASRYRVRKTATGAYSLLLVG